MDMQYQIMLMNDDHLMYGRVFVRIEFQFVHRFLMSIGEKKEFIRRNGGVENSYHKT
jgi:hypothetical protein